MTVRKEQIVFSGAVVVLGLFAWRSMSGTARKPSQGNRAKPPELVRFTAPDQALVLTQPRDAAAEVDDLFTQPSDTRPLPPLELEPPPLTVVPVLRPPSSPGPLPAHYGKLLREAPRKLEAPGLFARSEEAGGSGADEPVAPPAATQGKAAQLAPEELAARIASYKRLYDWFRIGEIRFGRIENRERYTLKKRPNENLLFTEFNPETGQPKFPGAAPLEVPRATVTEFAFAATIANQIEQRRVEFSDPLTASEYDLALAYADWCIDQRLETPRALQVAEEMLQRAAKAVPEDPAPKLGLARVYEAGFDFERAHELYTTLLQGDMARSPLVLVRLGELEARFRMFESAEARLTEAERYGRSQWRVQQALGRFLHERGRSSDAVAHLRLANQNEPQGPEFKAARAELRYLLGAALLGAGEATEAREWFASALQADASEQRARAGLFAADATLGKPLAAASLDAESAGFDLVFAHGHALALERSPDAAAKAVAELELAARIDPLRAYLPWRTLAWLAEAAGQPEEAQRYSDLAFENAPVDPWTLYQRGRLFVARDELDGAQEAFSAALEREIGFVDVLYALGDLAHRRADRTAADRYLERALALDPTLVHAQALRGVNFLEQGALADAEDCFRRVLSVDPDHPTARNGLSWCFYRRGESEEALTRLRELDDNRRAQGEADPHRNWALGQIARLTDHLQKFAWTDRFERVNLGNGWDTQEGNGPQVTMHDGVASIGGTFKQNGRSRLWQTRLASEFVAFEAKLTVRAGTTSRVGVFVVRETQRASETSLEAEASVSRHFDPLKNTVQTRAIKRGEEELPYVDVQGFEWKIDQPVVLRIERTGKDGDTRVRMLLDGIPVLEDKPLPSLGRTTQTLRMGVFAEGQPGRAVQVDVDDVEIVSRRANG